MKFPITKAEFLAWCRENGGVRVMTQSCSHCIVARAMQELTGEPWEVGLRVALCGDKRHALPPWANNLASAFDGLDALCDGWWQMTVRHALREIDRHGSVPGFTKKELREASGLE